ncbi:MAG: protein-L-isoaspartate O-methyltransferase [Stenotrophomonas maltophilia]|nr:MAG: protein-L-isoaspartate O-methyltransferase [Stenotrophomonas maltophilia]
MTRATPAPTQFARDEEAGPGESGESGDPGERRLRYELIRQRLRGAIVEQRIEPGLVLLEGPVAKVFGTGSGFLSACIGALARDVLSLEIDPELAAAARARLDASGLGTNVRVEVADALSWQTERRFDVICVTGAVDVVPSQFASWLRPGGRLFVIHGRSPAMEALLVKADGSTESLFETDIDYLRGAAPAPQFHL